MTNPILNFSSNQTLSNYLVSVIDAQALIDASLVTSGIPTFNNATAYVTGNVVYYLGIYYIAPSNIGSGGGTPLVNTTWKQIPTWGSYTTTATAAGTTTLDLYSSEIQRFSGVTTQTIVLPVVTTLPALGKPFYIINDSTGTLTVNSSGGNLVATILGGQRYLINCILLTGTTAASWTVSSGYETTTTIGALISGSTAKTVLVDADLIPLDDSAASNILKNITWQNLKASIFNYTTTATAAGTTTLTAASSMHQFFTGATTQTVVMPVTSTLYTGLRYVVVNNSSGLVTVQSSGANTILILAGGTSAEFVCILASGTTAASWHAIYNGVAVTSGKKASISNSITFAGTDGTTQTFQGTDTILGRGTTDTITGVKTFNDATLKLNGATSGASTLKAPAIASTYVHTLPARTGTIADDTDLALKMALAGTETVTGEKTVSGVPFHLLRTGSDTESDIATLVASSAFVSEGAFVANRFYPLVGIRMTDNNATIINAGMYAQFTNNGSILYLGASNGYAGGIDKTLKLNFDGVVELLNGQLKFPATQNASSDANTLDDYEEGDVVVAFTTTSGSITIATSRKTLSYTKIGRRVSLNGLLGVDSVSTPGGNIQITGLPFTCLSGDKGISSNGIKVEGLAATVVSSVTIDVTAGATTATLQKLSAGTAAALAADVSSSSYFYVSLSYNI